MLFKSYLLSDILLGYIIGYIARFAGYNVQIVFINCCLSCLLVVSESLSSLLVSESVVNFTLQLCNLKRHGSIELF